MDREFRKEMEKMSAEARERAVGNSMQFEEEEKKKIEMEVRKKIIESGEILSEEAIIERVEDEIWHRKSNPVWGMVLLVLLTFSFPPVSIVIAIVISVMIVFFCFLFKIVSVLDDFVKKSIKKHKKGEEL